MIRKKRDLRLKRNKAVGFLFFLMLIIPAIFFGISMASDYGRIILAHRQANDTAESVLMAASSSFLLDGNGAPTGTLDPTVATTNALSTFNMALSANSIYPSFSPILSSTSLDPTGKIVTVRVDFSINPGLLNYFGFSAPVKGFIIKSAKVCDPDQGDTCASPLN